MLALPVEFTNLIGMFSKRVGCSVPALMAGAILTTRRRTIAAVRRVMGLSHIVNSKPILGC